MQQCGCCGRHLMVGETFRIYRRRLRGRAIVCKLCRATALGRGWVPEKGPTFRQLNRKPRPVRKLVTKASTSLRREPPVRS